MQNSDYFSIPVTAIGRRRKLLNQIKLVVQTKKICCVCDFQFEKTLGSRFRQIVILMRNEKQSHFSQWNTHTQLRYQTF
jgi:hypothetical protein